MEEALLHVHWIMMKISIRISVLRVEEQIKLGVQNVMGVDILMKILMSLCHKRSIYV